MQSLLSRLVPALLAGAICVPHAKAYDLPPPGPDDTTVVFLHAAVTDCKKSQFDVYWRDMSMDGASKALTELTLMEHNAQSIQAVERWNMNVKVRGLEEACAALVYSQYVRVVPVSRPQVEDTP